MGIDYCHPRHHHGWLRHGLAGQNIAVCYKWLIRKDLGRGRRGRLDVTPYVVTAYDYFGQNSRLPPWEWRLGCTNDDNICIMGA